MAHTKIRYQKNRTNLLLTKLHTREKPSNKERGRQRCPATYTETNITESKEEITKIFVSLGFDNDDEKIDTIEENQLNDYIV